MKSVTTGCSGHQGHSRFWHWNSRRLSTKRNRSSIYLSWTFFVELPIEVQEAQQEFGLEMHTLENGSNLRNAKLVLLNQLWLSVSVPVPALQRWQSDITGGVGVQHGGPPAAHQGRKPVLPRRRHVPDVMSPSRLACTLVTLNNFFHKCVLIWSCE